MPEHSQYGCNIRNPTPIEVIRNTLEREIRSKLHELAPGVDPGVILDVLVDVQADAHAQATALTVNMRVMHSVGYSPPLATQGNFAAEPTGPQRGYSNPWMYRPFSDESARQFRQEYMGAFLPSPPPLTAPSFPLIGMAGMDQGQLGDCTAFSVHEVVGRGVVNPRAMARVPTMPLHSNPTINLDDIRQRRFNLIDRAGPPPAPLHPWVQAVIRAKSPPQPPPVPVVLDNEPFRGPVPPRRSVWKRLRENYALL